jgi:hypothetical protein
MPAVVAMRARPTLPHHEELRFRILNFVHRMVDGAGFVVLELVPPFLHAFMSAELSNKVRKKKPFFSFFSFVNEKSTASFFALRIGWNLFDC